MKIMNCQKQANQPITNTRDELIEFDVKYLIEYLGKVRNTCLEIVDRPDTSERNSPQPDYLIKDNKTSNFIALEYSEFFEDEKIRKKEATQTKKENFYVGFLNFSNPKKLGERLCEFFDAKLGKEQFSNFECERILLVRNRWSGLRTKHFIKAEEYFNPKRRSECNHFYIIVEQQLLEIF